MVRMKLKLQRSNLKSIDNTRIDETIFTEAFSELFESNPTICVQNGIWSALLHYHFKNVFESMLHRVGSVREQKYRSAKY